MCRLESTRSQLLGSGIVELLQPLLFSSDSHDASLEFTAPEVMEALDDPAVVAKYVTRPIRCDNAAFVRCMFLLVGLSGDPMVRQAEMLDVSASLGAICDQLRWEILGVMNRRGGQSQAQSLRLLQLGAIPHLVRFLTLGEAIGEDPNTTEEAFGGMLAPDEFVGADGSSDIVEARRRERRRLAAVALYRLCAHESTTSRIFLPAPSTFSAQCSKKTTSRKCRAEAGCHRPRMSVSSFTSALRPQ